MVRPLSLEGLRCWCRLDWNRRAKTANSGSSFSQPRFTVLVPSCNLVPTMVCRISLPGPTGPHPHTHAHAHTPTHTQTHSHGHSHTHTLGTHTHTHTHTPLVRHSSTSPSTTSALPHTGQQTRQCGVHVNTHLTPTYVHISLLAGGYGQISAAFGPPGHCVCSF